MTGFSHGIANDIAALVNQLHAPIGSEPFGRVLLEAITLKTPFVASNGGAVPEIVLDGECGLLFEPGDANDLCRCLCKLLSSDKKKGAQIAEDAYRRLTGQFSIARNSHPTELLYESILKNRRR